VALTQSNEDRRGKRRKVAAILAGGLVVGVGTMATLASWNDAEYASGSFTAGSFNLQGSTDQSTFSEHATAGAAASLTFTAPVTALTPTDTVYSGYALRLDKASTNAGTIAVTAGSSTGTVTNVTYTLFTTATSGCTAASTPVTTIVTNATALGSVGTPTNFAVAKPVNATTDGVPTYLCFKVTAGSGLVQGQTGTASWVFTATSN
jgi:predicted ribosomally synthesized peptide with SipW-like signal peptide